MADLSNKTLALLVGAAIVVSLVGIFVAQRGTMITGYSTSEAGNVTVEVQEQLWINITDWNATFPAGDVIQEEQWALIYTDTTAPVNWTGAVLGQADPLTVCSYGNTAINVTIKSDKSSADWVTGETNTLSHLSYKTVNVLGCDDPQGTYKELEAANVEYKACNDLNKGAAGHDQCFHTYFFGNISHEVDPGNYTMQITYTAHTLS